MEQNKIEEQIREKLNSREIQPSAQAWDRLDAMLSVAEEKKTRRPFGFLFIAASILVFVTLGMFLFMEKGTKIEPQNNVVDTAIKNDTTRNPIQNNNTPIIGVEKQNEVVTSSENQPTINKSIINQKTTTNQKANDNQNQIIKDKAIEFQNASDVALRELPKISNPNQTNVSKPQYVNIEELLQSVEKSKTNTMKLSIKVNAASLLSQVDGEVEHTFREKVFSRINKNYQEIKVALTNRNQE
jgi:hypothetical protein